MPVQRRLCLDLCGWQTSLPVVLLCFTDLFTCSFAVFYRPLTWGFAVVYRPLPAVLLWFTDPFTWGFALVYRPLLLWFTDLYLRFCCGLQTPYLRFCCVLHTSLPAVLLWFTDPFTWGFAVFYRPLCLWFTDPFSLVLLFYRPLYLRFCCGLQMSLPEVWLWFTSLFTCGLQTPLPVVLLCFTDLKLYICLFWFIFSKLKTKTTECLELWKDWLLITRWDDIT